MGKRLGTSQTKALNRPGLPEAPKGGERGRRVESTISKQPADANGPLLGNSELVNFFSQALRVGPPKNFVPETHKANGSRDRPLRFQMRSYPNSDSWRY
jgi:hypothetical protein